MAPKPSTGTSATTFDLRPATELDTVAPEGCHVLGFGRRGHGTGEHVLTTDELRALVNKAAGYLRGLPK